MGRANGEVHANLGGPFFATLGPPIPAPHLSAGGRYGVADWIDPFDNCEKIAMLDPAIPVMIIHGSGDIFVVPVHARLLSDAASSDELILHWAEGADHSEIPVVAGADYERWLREFIDDHLPP